MVKKPDLLKKATVNQLDKFKEAARKVETDDSEEAFDERLKRVAKRLANDAKAPEASKR